MAIVATDNTHYGNIAAAIREKNGLTASYKPSEMAEAIRAIQTGGGSGSVSPEEVNFYDYDGTLVAAYTLAEAKALTALPDGPVHEGLVFQGWNWTLDKVKALTMPMNVGAMYITDYGKTRLYIRIAAEGRMNVPLYFSQTVAGGVTIDWGDGSGTETLSGTGNVNTAHTYAGVGDYVITLDPADGCTLGLGAGSSSYCVMGSTGNSGRVYCNMLQKVELGRSVTSIGSNAFQSCYSLASVTIPDGATSVGIGEFKYCYSLASVTIPDGVTRINVYAFQYCYGMAEYHLKPTTPPTLSSTTAFTGIQSDCVIYVPAGCLEAYQTATNWATYADKMQEEPV